MAKNVDVFESLLKTLPGAKDSAMFGARCIKAPNGKAVLMIWKDDLVFKLTEEAFKKISGLKGVHVFTPVEGRSMAGWYNVPPQHADKWPELAQISMQYVQALPAAKTVAKKGKK
ncbi:MAG: hypothetical protein R2794_08025 [Chitinophagales bacterium]